MYHEKIGGRPAAHRPPSRITTAQPVIGRPRTCLPARAGRTGPEAWRYPEEDDSTVVRGQD
ncbi:hypothetical protein [Actinacidiphila acidipaludis]|uniref:Uncharacterized protein n=1 Tax=Actinacidiphila acidipaludis TaxID=2873382 RepID=A0ABS7QE79_9ACTN|nr:hypothetical protein [Streptomyces acidipaludis]MBY8881485.1 hypothetical protein [Streptomyces acidipaludis]